MSKRNHIESNPTPADQGSEGLESRPAAPDSSASQTPHAEPPSNPPVGAAGQAWPSTYAPPPPGYEHWHPAYFAPPPPHFEAPAAPSMGPRGGTAGPLGARAADLGDRGMSALGHGAYALAAGIRTHGRRMDVDPSQLNAATAPIDSAGRYLVHSDPRRVAEDVDHAVRSHPYRAMVIGAAVGWVVGRFLSK